jgi:hypothetical protein
MATLLDIIGVFLYIAFRIIVFPIVVLLYFIFFTLVTIRQIHNYSNLIDSIKLKSLIPLYRNIRIRLQLNKI